MFIHAHGRRRLPLVWIFALIPLCACGGDVSPWQRPSSGSDAGAMRSKAVRDGDGPAELVYKVLTSPRPSPSQVRGGRIPEELENLVVDCLSMGPASRPPTFRSVKERLKSIPLPERWNREVARDWWNDNREKVARFAQATS